MNLIVCYDVRKTKRRNKIAALLEGYGQRANYSVFELDVSEGALATIKQKIAEFIDPKADKVLFYRICKTCMAKSSPR